MRSIYLVRLAYSIRDYEVTLTSSFENFSKTPGAFESILRERGVLKFVRVILFLFTPQVQDDYENGIVTSHRVLKEDSDRIISRRVYPVWSTIEYNIREYFPKRPDASFMWKMTILNGWITSTLRKGEHHQRWQGWLYVHSRLFGELKVKEVKGIVCSLAGKWVKKLYEEVLRVDLGPDQDRVFAVVEEIVRWVLCGLYVDVMRKSSFRRIRAVLRAW